jgi:hypothetical protein
MIFKHQKNNEKELGVPHQKPKKAAGTTRIALTLLPFAALCPLAYLSA